jgi:hypothetical protein
MLVGLSGVKLCVNIHYAIEYPSDIEQDDDLWVVSFVLGDMGEVLS